MHYFSTQVIFLTFLNFATNKPHLKVGVIFILDFLHAQSTGLKLFEALLAFCELLCYVADCKNTILKDALIIIKLIL